MATAWHKEAVLPQFFLQKSLDSQKSWIDLKKALDSNFQGWSFNRFAWNHLFVYFIAQNQLHILQGCWNRSCGSAEIFRLETFRFLSRVWNGNTRETFWINRNQPDMYFYCTDPAKKWRYVHRQDCSSYQNRSESKKKPRLKKLVCSLGANLHATIHVINCFSEKMG